MPMRGVFACGNVLSMKWGQRNWQIFSLIFSELLFRFMSRVKSSASGLTWRMLWFAGLRGEKSPWENFLLRLTAELWEWRFISAWWLKLRNYFENKQIRNSEFYYVRCFWHNKWVLERLVCLLRQGEKVSSRNSPRINFDGNSTQWKHTR